MSKVYSQVSIVKASAGSGKTYALAKQYTHLLINSPNTEDLPFREILAMTFTNKASLEMKERILEFLKKIALNKFSDEDEKKELLSSLDSQSSGKKALFLMDQLIRNFHFFRVQTIDSFIKSLLSGCTFKMNFSSSFMIKEDYGENMAYSLDKLIDRAREDRKILDVFVRFLKQYLYIENRVSWFLKRDILSLMEAMFYFSNIYGDKFRKQNIKATHLIIRKREAIRQMRKLKVSAPHGTSLRFFKSLTSFLDKNTENFDIDSIPGSFDNPEFPINKGYSLPPETGKLWDRIKKNLKEICEQESHSLLDPYIDIFDMVLDIFKNLAAADDTVFLEELNRQARALFEGGTINIGELYYRIATRFRHYLIDEFQDTSLLQWKNIVQLVEEALSTGGTFFCVGDRKQAIYRFRGGEPSLLDYVEDRFKNFNVEHKFLNMNFRSQKEIVLFNNNVFSEKNLRDFIREKESHEKGKDKIKFLSTDADDIVRAFQDSGQNYVEKNDRGYVRIECVEAQDKEERESIIKDKVISLIEELGKRFSYEGIAVLARDNDDVELITKWLLGKGIPVESGKTLNIKEESHIKELISFLRFLNSPIDNLSFSSFIMGDIFTRVSRKSREEMRDFIFEIRKKTVILYLYREFRERYPELWGNLIEGFFKSVGFVPLYEFAVSILNKFNVVERFPEYQGFFMRFLELVKEQEETNASIPLFLDFFDRIEGDDLYVDIVDSKYVKVLTIHKSKGLEFPVVIIPFLALDIKVGMGKNFGTSFTVYPGNNGFTLRRLKKRYGNFSGALADLYREEYKKAFIDELNNIYVAFTRARDELYIFIPEKSPGANIAKLLLPVREEETQFGREASYKDESTGREILLKKIPVSKYSDWLPLLKDEFIDASQIKNRANILKGEVFHYILSFIGNLSQSKIDEILKSAIEGASLRFPLVRNLKEYEKVIEGILKDKNLKQFFFVDDGVVYQEKEFIDLFGDTYRVDRLIVKEKSVWVVDYKSSHEVDNFQKQIIKYVNAVRDIYPGRDVKGFLIFLDDFSVQEV